MEYDDRIQLNIFKPETTYQNDYVKFKLKKERLHWEQERSEPPQPQPEPYTPVDHETYLTWRKGVHIPFNLFWQPKEILSTNPHVPAVLNSDPSYFEDKDKDEAIRTRPRIYMSPAVSIDDVDEPEMRQLLCKHMYTTDWKKAAEEATAHLKKIERPSIEVEKTREKTFTTGDPVQLQLDFMAPLPDTFKNRGKDWEHKQRRALVDPTLMYWINKDPKVKCGACVNPMEGLISPEVKQTISELIKLDKLRLPHDKAIPGYAGYQPRLSYGVSLSKVDLPVVHPLLSTSQAITKRYAEDALPTVAE